MSLLSHGNIWPPATLPQRINLPRPRKAQHLQSLRSEGPNWFEKRFGIAQSTCGLGFRFQVSN